jgi:hypothetical protein
MMNLAKGTMLDLAIHTRSFYPLMNCVPVLVVATAMASQFQCEEAQKSPGTLPLRAGLGFTGRLTEGSRQSHRFLWILPRREA